MNGFLPVFWCSMKQADVQSASARPVTRCGAVGVALRSIPAAVWGIGSAKRRWETGTKAASMWRPWSGDPNGTRMVNQYESDIPYIYIYIYTYIYTYIYIHTLYIYMRTFGLMIDEFSLSCRVVMHERWDWNISVMIVLIRPQHLPDTVSSLPLVDMLHPPNYLGITVIFICFVSCIKLYLFYF